MSSDSLTYTDLDSLVRLYQNPIFYNEGNRQYTADSIYMVIKDKQMQKAHLLSNAFITMQEDPRSYNQIRGAEMVAYFDSTSALTRFDALGGAASLFYLEEKDALATVNKVETKMIYATFKDGEIERMYYYDNPKNDGYPTVQLPEDDRKLKGFRWEPERRPTSPLERWKGTCTSSAAVTPPSHRPIPSPIGPKPFSGNGRPCCGRPASSASTAASSATAARWKAFWSIPPGTMTTRAPTTAPA